MGIQTSTTANWMTQQAYAILPSSEVGDYKQLKDVILRLYEIAIGESTSAQIEQRTSSKNQEAKLDQPVYLHGANNSSS